MAKNTANRPAAAAERGSFVSEWYGHRVYPSVSKATAALKDQTDGRCPFLSAVTGERRPCIKAVASSGVCSVSSPSNGPRQDWLVCPYRALDDDLLANAARQIFGLDVQEELLMAPGPALAKPAIREKISRRLNEGQPAFVYLQDKLGGEIALPSTDRSPELSFDVTIAELEGTPAATRIGRYGIFEVQTMDFHGSYRHSVSNLRDALRLHGRNFPKVLQDNGSWLSERMEGPNIANVFKRTFYQILLKFRLAGHGSCAGAVLALPQAVWDSWQRHLGKPAVEPAGKGLFNLREPGTRATLAASRAWIYVFDLNATSAKSPDPIVLQKIIATDSNALAHYAFKVAPDAAVVAGGSADRVLLAIRNRLIEWWPGLV